MVQSSAEYAVLLNTRVRQGRLGVLRHQDWEAACIFSGIGSSRPIGRSAQERLDRWSRKEKHIVLIVQITYLDLSLFRARTLAIVDGKVHMRGQSNGRQVHDCLLNGTK